MIKSQLADLPGDDRQMLVRFELDRKRQFYPLSIMDVPTDNPDALKALKELPVSRRRIDAVLRAAQKGLQTCPCGTICDSAMELVHACGEFAYLNPVKTPVTQNAVEAVRAELGDACLDEEGVATMFQDLAEIQKTIEDNTGVKSAFPIIKPPWAKLLEQEETAIAVT